MNTTKIRIFLVLVALILANLACDGEDYDTEDVIGVTVGVSENMPQQEEDSCMQIQEFLGLCSRGE